MHFSKVKGLIVLCVTLLSLIMSPVRAEQIDRIVAVVNQDIITQGQLDLAVNHVKGQMAAANTPIPSDDVLRKQILDQLIDQQLQTQIAKKMNMKVSPAQVNQAIDNIVKQNGITLDQLKQKLSENGVAYTDYVKNIEQQLVLQQLMQQVAGGNIDVTQGDINKFLEEAKKQLPAGSQQYHILDVVVTTADSASKDELQVAEQKAKDILAKLKQGADPSTVNANQLGVQVQDLDWRPLAALPEIFTASIGSMKNNDVAGPFKAPNGFHVIKLIDKRGDAASLPNAQEAKQLVYQQKMQKELKRWLSEIRKQSYIHVIDKP